MIICTARNYPEVAKNLLRQFTQPIEGVLEQYFNRLVERGFFRKINPRLAVRVYFGVWSNISILRDHQYAKEVMHIPEEDEFADMVDIFLGGCIKYG